MPKKYNRKVNSSKIISIIFVRRRGLIREIIFEEQCALRFLIGFKLLIRFL